MNTRTNSVIDDELLAQAMVRAREKTKKRGGQHCTRH